MKFSVGMAYYDDPNCPTEAPKAIFTVMDLFSHHPQVAEVIVVDNNPIGPGPYDVQRICEKAGARYFAMPTPQGTSPPRNKIFELANHDHVACIDSHVILQPGFFPAIEKFYEAYGKGCLDLLHGSLVTERRGEVMATHMNDQWRDQMWGTWGKAWMKGNKEHRFSRTNNSRCRDCGIYLSVSVTRRSICPQPKYLMFSVIQIGEDGLEYVSLDTEGEQRIIDPEEFGLPAKMTWKEHDKKLKEAGCSPYLQEPFEIPGHGMGFFACRKEAWLPFHEDCRGFGGEEMTTAYRFRQAGRKVWCVPGARWWHLFKDETEQPPYQINVWNRVRNYALEFGRLGLDKDVIKNHFGEYLPALDWEEILVGKAWPDQKPGMGQQGPPPTDLPPHRCPSCLKVVERFIDESTCPHCGHQPPKVAMTAWERHAQKVAKSKPATPPATLPAVSGLEDLYEKLSVGRTSLMAELRSMAAACAGRRRVVEIGTLDGGGTTALLAGRPAELTTFDISIRSKGVATLLATLCPPECKYSAKLFTMENLLIPECDLLVINAGTPTEANQLMRQFAKRAENYIAVTGLKNGKVAFLKSPFGWSYLKYEGGVAVLSKGMQ